MDLLQALPHLTAVDVSANELARLSDVADARARAAGAGEPALEVLQMGANRIAGNLEMHRVFAAFPRLRLFNASANRLTGRMPTYLPRALEVLSVAHNRLDGNLPVPYPEARLRLYDVAGNRIGGTVTQHVFANAPSLRVLDVSGNEISGLLPAPADDGPTPPLKVYALSANRFVGDVPSALGRVVGLATLDVSGNRLDGTLPESLLDLSSLVHLNVSNNALTGVLPGSSDAREDLDTAVVAARASGIASWPSLASLDVSGNRLEGRLPNWLGGLSRAERIELGNNRLTGSFPRGLSRLRYLRRLGACGNRIEGPLPAGLADSPALVSLSVCNNKLSGPLPLALATRPELVTFDIDGNSFTYEELGEMHELKEVPSDLLSDGGAGGRDEL